jgi:hypothetical protein
MAEGVGIVARAQRTEMPVRTSRWSRQVPASRADGAPISGFNSARCSSVSCRATSYGRSIRQPSLFGRLSDRLSDRPPNLFERLSGLRGGGPCRRRP